MGLEAGKDCFFTLEDSIPTVRNLTGYVLAFRGNFTGHKLIDVTVMGSTGHLWASDELEDNSFEFDFLFDPIATTGPWAVLESLRDETEVAAFVIGPYGNTGGYLEISGNCWLENLPIEVSLGDMVKLSGCSFKVHGAAAFGTF